jgi:hypothetical protein
MNALIFYNSIVGFMLGFIKIRITEISEKTISY